MAVLHTYTVYPTPRAGFGTTQEEAKKNAQELNTQLKNNGCLTEVKPDGHRVRAKEYAWGIDSHDVVYS